MKLSALFFIRVSTLSTASTISFKLLDTSNAKPVPCCISLIDISIRFLVLAAAFELSSAKEPISVATTAKPLPASPALAASIEALRANKLVWEAISSIVFIMLTTWLEVSVILSIASIICLVLSSAVSIISLTLSASEADILASFVFCSIWSVTEEAVAESSSMAADWLLAFSAIFWAAFERSSAPADTCVELLIILFIISCNEAEIFSREALTFANSPA